MSEGQRQNGSSFGRPTAVTVVAIGNIVFALLCNCIYFTWVATPVVMEIQKSVFQQIGQQFEAERKKEIARLLQKRQVAKTQQEKREIDAQIAAIKAAKVPDIGKALTTPQTKAFYYGVGVFGLVLNLLFLVSGIGLLAMASWAYKLAIVASALRILEQMFSAAYHTFVIAPATGQIVQGWLDLMRKMTPPSSPPPPALDMITAVQVWSAIGSFYSLALYCAWPITVLVILFLPHVREAFRYR